MAEKTKTAEELAADVKAQFDKSLGEVREIAEKATAEAEKGVPMAESAKEKADEALTNLNELKAQVDEFIQKSARGGGQGDAQKSIGSQFTESDEFKAFQANPAKGTAASLTLKADLSTSVSTPSNVVAGGMGAAIHATHLPGIQGMPQRRMTIRDLLMPGQTDTPIIDYDKETGFTNNAEPVAEGALKPQSDITISEESTRTKVLAHWMRASKQALDDVSQLRSLIDNRLLYGLAFKEEAQLLYGDGTGENLKGIVPQATAYSAPLTLSDETSIDTIRLMMLQAALAEYPASGIVMNPIDWTWIETLKDTTGRYIIGNPQGTIGATLWSLPVVTTQSMAADKVLVGAFDMGAQIFDQWQARIEVGYQNDDFTKNKVTVLAEERLALAVYRPEAFIYGDFGRVA